MPGSAEPTRRRVLPPGGRRLAVRTADGLDLRALFWRPEGVGRSIAIVPGRGEFIERYAETVADLLDRGVAVAVLDMRGHGLSPRLPGAPLEHHLDDFAPMVEDVRRFLAAMADAGMPGPFGLLAHSMGAHVTLRLLHDRPGIVARALLVAPMTAIRFRFPPAFCLRLLAAAMCRLGRGKAWAPGQAKRHLPAARARAFSFLTSDPGRYADEAWQLAENPALALGGVSWGWLDAAFRSSALLTKPGYPEAIPTPVLFVLGGADRVVDNAATRALAARMPAAETVDIEGARHEILRERDDLRDRLFAHLDRFFGLDV